MTLHNLAVSPLFLEDILFTETEITSKIEIREHIFEIKHNEQTLGFASLIDLKSYTAQQLNDEHDEHDEQNQKLYFVKNIDQHEWKNLYEHPALQRRKPQLISTQNFADIQKDDDDFSFFVLKKGQKTGPYSKQKLLEMIKDKDIILTDMVSFDGGHTWPKLYQVDVLDRRALKDNYPLPEIPDNHFLNTPGRPNKDFHNIRETNDAITSLAFLGNLKPTKSIHSIASNKENIDKDEMMKKAKTSSIYKWLFIASLIGTIYFLVTIKSQVSSPFQGNTDHSIGEQPDNVNTTEDQSSFGSLDKRNNSNSITNQKRTGKFETRQLKPVRAASRKSLTQTDKFKQGMEENSSNDAEDSNYYYDNSAPMELDPVRAQVSKENFDNAGEPPTPPPFNQEMPN